MKIACLGGGPAGLYFAIAMKLRDAAHEIHVFERNKAGDTFGWGVVFSDQTLSNLTETDPVSAKTISDSFAHWDDIEVTVEDRSIVSSGHGFIGIGRKHLLQILQARARELGVVLHFETECSPDMDQYAAFDLIVAADGVNSPVRTAHADRFEPQIEVRRNKFIWLGTKRLFDAFAFIFEPTEHGWIWAHAYRFSGDTSTFIVECSPETWSGLGFDRMTQAEAIAACEKIFERHLAGNPLITNAAHLRGSEAWINFRRIVCRRWSFDNVVLLGDAAHTAHFSIGSGTKLALEDAIKLAAVLDRPGLDSKAELAAALEEYQEERHTAVLRIQNAARNSTEWFETVERYMHFKPRQFAYSLLTRSQRISHENLRLRDGPWLADVEKDYWRDATAIDGENGTGNHSQPIFAPYRIKSLTLPNRIAMAPMLTYMADRSGMTTPFHLTHYTARALGGTGLIMTEMLATDAAGRATRACPGLYDDDQIRGWREINAFIHAQTAAKTCAQIGHAGARAACKIPDEGAGYDDPLDDPWPIVSASDRPWREDGIVPAAVDEAEIDDIVNGFAQAARRAHAAGFDMVEVQAGHGFLLSSFITPIMNHRTDAFGGDLAARMTVPLRVVDAMKSVWPADKPIAVRISATDWAGERGILPRDAVEIARMLKEAGVDMIDVSAGETDPSARPVYGRMFQTPFADRIRNELHMPVIAVGNIEDADQANSVLAAGRADLVAVGRPHLSNPMLTMHAAAQAGYTGQFVPPPYRTGHDQMSRAARKARMASA
ncbi:MAG: bifunctional salicylyl-CoA 5-hydroxylase/oxidoreductase [Parerythrobacter sp.]